MMINDCFWYVLGFNAPDLCICLAVQLLLLNTKKHAYM